MYRCHPQTTAIVEAVRRGEIGRLTHVRTSFAFHVRNTEHNVRFEPAMAGGALMDVGCYCLDFSRLLADAPLKSLSAVRRMHDGGVDIMTSGLIEYENGVQATFTCGMDAQSDNGAIISGSDGYIAVGWPWKPNNETAGFTVHGGVPPRQDLGPGQKPVAPPPRRVEARSDVPLFALEARAFAAACHGESAFMPREATLANAAALEAATGRAAPLP